MPGWVRIVFIEILIPILTALLGFFSHDSIVKKIDKRKTKTNIVAKGDHSQAAGRDINNDKN